jgi:hypothetical protein
MTPERLRTIIDSYGADPARWPAAEREAAQALLATSGTDAALRGLHAEAVRLDAALSALPLPPLPLAAPAATLLARARERSGGAWLDALRWLLGISGGGFSPARPLLAALMPLALGFSAGVALELPEPPGADEAVMQAALYAFVEPDSEEELP